MITIIGRNSQDSEPATDPHREWKIDHTGRIDKKSFRIAIGVLAAFATLLAVSRFLLRLKLHRKLFIDDILVLFGLMNLITATGTLYKLCNDMYVHEALMFDKTIVFQPSEIAQLLVSYKWYNIYVALIWTSIYAIKFSFLGFFYGLIRDYSKRFNYYIWTVIVVAAASWIFSIVEPFIICPYFGQAAMKCYPNSSYTLDMVLISLLTGLDILTDLLVISIPIMILRLSGIRRGQKLGIAIFLCLSVAMIVVCLVRFIGDFKPSVRAAKDSDTVWEMWLLHVEGCIAVIMGSVTAFRGIFATQLLSRRPEKTSYVPTRALQNIRSWFGVEKSRRHRDIPDISHNIQTPAIPDHSLTRATLSGVHRFIQKYKDDSAQIRTTIDTQFSNCDPQEEYHDFYRQKQTGYVGQLKEWPVNAEEAQTTQTSSDIAMLLER